MYGIETRFTWRSSFLPVSILQTKPNQFHTNTTLIKRTRGHHHGTPQAQQYSFGYSTATNGIVLWNSDFKSFISHTVKFCACIIKLVGQMELHSWMVSTVESDSIGNYFKPIWITDVFHYSSQSFQEKAECGLVFSVMYHWQTGKLLEWNKC
jgi:hypothetical protein